MAESVLPVTATREGCSREVMDSKVPLLA